TQDIIQLKYDDDLSKWIVVAYQNSATKTPVFTNSFESSEISVVTGTNVYANVAHGLGVVPKLVELVLRCKTAEFGYAVGNEFICSSGGRINNVGQLGLAVDATNIQILQ